jgi:carboxylesterase
VEREFIPGAEPLFLDGSDTGCLLIHGGGGGTTWDLKEFANNLHLRTGMTIWLPALIGYNTKPEDLYNVTFEDLVADVHSGLDKLLTTCKRVFVIGHSLGGILALVLASEREEVSGVVTWAAFLDVKFKHFSLLPVIKKIPLLKRKIPERVETMTPQWLKDQGWIGYDWLPSRLGFIVLNGMKRLKKSLRNVTCPTMVIQGSEDVVVTDDSAMNIFDEINPDRKSLHIINGANHPLMNESEYKLDLFNRTIDFLEEL